VAFASAGAGIGAGAGFSAGIGGGASFGAGASIGFGAGASAGASAGAGFGIGASASAKVPASAGAFAGLRTPSAGGSVSLSASRLTVKSATATLATDSGARFRLGGRAASKGAVGLSADVGAGASLKSRIQFKD
jgi:hypothetical protein